MVIAVVSIHVIELAVIEYLKLPRNFDLDFVVVGIKLFPVFAVSPFPVSIVVLVVCVHAASSSSP